MCCALSALCLACALEGGGVAGLACARRLGAEPSAVSDASADALNVFFGGALGFKATVFDTGKRGPSAEKAA